MVALLAGAVIVIVGGPVPPLPCPWNAPKSQPVVPVGRLLPLPPNHGDPLVSVQSGTRFPVQFDVRLAPFATVFGSALEGEYLSA